MTTELSAAAGATTIHGMLKIHFRPSLIIPPQSGVGGGMPNPRKPREPIAMIA